MRYSLISLKFIELRDLAFIKLKCKRELLHELQNEMRGIASLHFVKLAMTFGKERLRFVGIAQRADVGDEGFDIVIAELGLGGHGGIAKHRAAELDGLENMGVGELVHVGAVGVVARLGGE